MNPTIIITESPESETFSTPPNLRRPDTMIKEQTYQENKSHAMLTRVILCASVGNTRIMSGHRKHNMRDVVLQRKHWNYLLDKTSSGARAQIKAPISPRVLPPRRSTYVGLKPATLETRTKARINEV